MTIQAPINGEAGRGANAGAGSARSKRATPGRSRVDFHAQPTEVHMTTKSDIPEAIRQQLDAPTYNALARAIAAREKSAEQAGYARAVREYAAALRDDKPAEEPKTHKNRTLVICTAVLVMAAIGLAVVVQALSRM